MMNHVLKCVVFFCIILVSHSISNAQVDFKEPLDPYFSPKKIKKSKARSVTVFLDMNKEDISEKGSVSGKVQEVEFNSNGQITYRLRCENRGAPPFIDYGRGSYFETRSYDSKARLTHHLWESIQGTQQELTSYDSNGNRSSWIHMSKKDTLAVFDFEWEKGRMIKSNIHTEITDNVDWKDEFDEKGRVVLTIYNSLKIKYSYSTVKDSLFTSIAVYRGEKLISTEELTTLVSIDRVTHWARTDSTGVIDAIMDVCYDKNGNATEYFFEEDKAISFRIENIYDRRKRLVKRLVYKRQEEGNEEQLTRVERYVYEQTALVYRLKKGDLDKGK